MEVGPDSPCTGREAAQSWWHLWTDLPAGPAWQPWCQVDRAAPWGIWPLGRLSTLVWGGEERCRELGPLCSAARLPEAPHQPAGPTGVGGRWSLRHTAAWRRGLTRAPGAAKSSLAPHPCSQSSSNAGGGVLHWGCGVAGGGAALCTGRTWRRSAANPKALSTAGPHSSEHHLPRPASPHTQNRVERGAVH